MKPSNNIKMGRLKLRTMKKKNLDNRFYYFVIHEGLRCSLIIELFHYTTLLLFRMILYNLYK